MKTAIIAGTGLLPIEACKNIKEPFFVVSLFPEDNLTQLKEAAKDVIPQNFCKASAILNLLKSKGATKVLLIGKVDKNNLLKKLKLDWLAIKLLASSFSKSDKTLMEKILKLLEDNGIEVIKQNEVLNSLLIPPGLVLGKLTPTIKKDIQLGLNLSLKISNADIGQTIIMKDGMVIAIEAIEGTDKCIRRGIELGKTGIVICKAAHLGQNKKYDLPTLGPSTLEGVLPGEVSAIAWQSTQTFIADKEKFIAKAKELKITLVSS